MFEVKEKIYCIDDSIPEQGKKNIQLHNLMFPNWIKKDKIYTVREIFGNDGIVTGILLEELHNPKVWIQLISKYQEGSFAEWRFRKLTPIESLSLKQAESIKKTKSVEKVRELQLN